MNDDSGREQRSELTSICFPSPLAFGTSFEELANFLIDKVVDAEPTLGLGRFWILDLNKHQAIAPNPITTRSATHLLQALLRLRALHFLRVRPGTSSRINFRSLRRIEAS
jgi:hypothetical protein